MLLVSSTDQNGVMPPGSQGSVLCLGSGGAAIGRYHKDIKDLGGSPSYTSSLRDNDTGGGSYGLPNSIGGSIQAGETWHFQNWSRNGSGDARFSQGLSITFAP